MAPKIYKSASKLKKRHKNDADSLVPTNSYLKKVLALKKTISCWDNFFTCDEIERQQAWIRIEILGQPLMDKYSWAIPDERALSIIGHFAPIVEVGCGKGYWASLLRKRGIDIVAIDKYVDLSECWTEVLSGSSTSMKTLGDANSRTLFLCYPDDTEQLGIEALDAFEGEHIIHVGELLSTGGTLSGAPQAPFGRTSSADFQVQLASSFHCLLVARLPSFPYCSDAISVWKRTSFVAGRCHSDDSDAADEDDTDDTHNARNSRQGHDDEESDDDSNDGEDLWASIPAAEVLEGDHAAPCLSHLLQSPNTPLKSLVYDHPY